VDEFKAISDYEADKFIAAARALMEKDFDTFTSMAIAMITLDAILGRGAK